MSIYNAAGYSAPPRPVIQGNLSVTCSTLELAHDLCHNFKWILPLSEDEICGSSAVAARVTSIYLSQYAASRHLNFLVLYEVPGSYHCHCVSVLKVTSLPPDRARVTSTMINEGLHSIIVTMHWASNQVVV